MADKLLNTKEVSRYLGISEEELRELVDKGEIPAYRLGGTILRFRKDQIDEIKTRGIPLITKLEEESLSSAVDSRSERWRDFFYFNDFYIISGIIILILLVVILFC